MQYQTVERAKRLPKRVKKLRGEFVNPTSAEAIAPSPKHRLGTGRLVATVNLEGKFSTARLLVICECVQFAASVACAGRMDKVSEMPGSVACMIFLAERDTPVESLCVARAVVLYVQFAPPKAAVPPRPAAALRDASRFRTLCFPLDCVNSRALLR